MQCETKFNRNIEIFATNEHFPNDPIVLGILILPVYGQNINSYNIIKQFIS